MRGTQLLHWIRYLFGIDSALTQTTEAERTAISSAAKGRRNLVELGVFEGVTSLVLRKAMASDGCLNCVDPFFRGALGISYGLSITKREIAKSRNGNVCLFHQLSHEVAVRWKKPVDFIFFDGDHSEEGVRRDWHDWSPFLVAGAMAAFHDSCGPTAVAGPAALVGELEQPGSGYSLVNRVDSLSIFNREQSRQ